MKKPKSQVLWTLGELRVLRRACANGMSARIIRKSLLISRHSLGGISTKMAELGLARNREKSLNARRNDPAARKRIVEFLAGEGRNMPSLDAAQRLNISQCLVRYYRRKYGLRLPTKLCFTSKHFASTHAHVMKQMRQALADSRPGYWEKKKELMLRQLNRDAILNCIYELLTCKGCGQKWPRNSKYFYYGRKTKSGVQYILPYCRGGCGRHLWRTKIAA